MTYQDIKTALKSFQEQGYAIPALNSKREVLESALIELQKNTAEKTAEETADPVVTIEEITPEEIPQVAIDPIEVSASAVVAIEPIQDIPQLLENTLETLPINDSNLSTNKPIAPRPVSGWQLVSLEIKDDLKFVGTTLIWAIALVRSIIRFTTPYLIRASHKALRWAVYGVVAFRLFILPKLTLLAYYLGIWGVTIALRVVRSRRWSIA